MTGPELITIGGVDYIRADIHEAVLEAGRSDTLRRWKEATKAARAANCRTAEEFNAFRLGRIQEREASGL